MSPGKSPSPVLIFLVVKVKENKGKGKEKMVNKASDNLEEMDRVLLRIPPISLFRMMTNLTEEQRQSVLDKFNEDSCSLIFSGNTITFTRETVHEVLGIPMGIIHVALKGTSCSNKLTKSWKGYLVGILDTHNQAGIAHNGGIVPLLKLFYSNNGTLQHNGAFTLYGLADNEDNIADLISLGGVQKLMDWEFIIQVNFLTADGWGTSNGKPFGLVRIADCGEISKDNRKKRRKYSSPDSEIESDSSVTDSYSEPDSDSSNDRWRQKKWSTKINGKNCLVNLAMLKENIMIDKLNKELHLAETLRSLEMQQAHEKGDENRENELYKLWSGMKRDNDLYRPQPLIEVDPPSGSGDVGSENKGSEKPLEKEPMLAARIMIKDGISILFDVDNIDRLLQVNQPQDGGSQARQRRQIMLEGLAAALLLVDPLGVSSNTSSGLAPKDDIVFLRVVSLLKGRKLVSRYLQLLSPTSETITALAKIVKTCISAMDLNSLSACLVAIVCSPEQLPLSPIGSRAGNGAFIILKSVLESATQLLSGANSSLQNQHFGKLRLMRFWAPDQVLLKYDSLVQSMYAQIPPSTEIVFLEAAKGISQEILMELLRANLPHTYDNQRKMLVDFSQRSMHVTGYSGHKGGGQVALADTF
ncbi:PAT1 homolog 1-like protein [Tanacetum coccineum]